MAGFPKYPVPRYMQLRMWIINRNWKRNSLNLFVGSVLLGIILSRTFLLHNVPSRSSTVCQHAIQYHR
jgi:hypothetical protein